MSVFADKKFEELDWISQATEPIDSELNVYLGELPDQLEIDFPTYLRMLGDGWNIDLSLDRVVSYCLNNLKEVPNLSWSQRDELRKCFKFEFEGTPTLNFIEQSITDGKILLVKQSSTFDEQILEKLLGREGVDAVRNAYIPSDAGSRINDIMELVGSCESGLRTRSLRNKRRALYDRLVKLFKQNEWNIKDTTLANKVGFWIRDYISDGNLAAYSNFCRLKVMTHKGQPIYSMEEVK